MTVCYEEASAARKAALGCCKTGHIKETTKMAALWLRGSFLLKAREIEDIQSPGHLKESRAERRESRLGMDISGALSLSQERKAGRSGEKNKRDQYSGRARRKSLTTIERTKGFLGGESWGGHAQGASLDSEVHTCK